MPPRAPLTPISGNKTPRKEVDIYLQGQIIEWLRLVLRLPRYLTSSQSREPLSKESLKEIKIVPHQQRINAPDAPESFLKEKSVISYELFAKNLSLPMLSLRQSLNFMFLARPTTKFLNDMV